MAALLNDGGGAVFAFGTVTITAATTADFASVPLSLCVTVQFSMSSIRSSKLLGLPPSGLLCSTSRSRQQDERLACGDWSGATMVYNTLQLPHTLSRFSLPLSALMIVGSASCGRTVGSSARRRFRRNVTEISSEYKIHFFKASLQL